MGATFTRPGPAAARAFHRRREIDVEASSINWILAIACLLAGIGLGALGYHLLNAGTAGVQRLRQRLAERDRELAALRDGMGDHFGEVTRLAETLRRDTEALARRLEEDARELGGQGTPRRGLAVEAPAVEEAEVAAEATPPPAPRDYADGSGGTLSEDFGLREGESREPQAPRY